MSELGTAKPEMTESPSIPKSVPAGSNGASTMVSDSSTKLNVGSSRGFGDKNLIRFGGNDKRSVGNGRDDRRQFSRSRSRSPYG